MAIRLLVLLIHMLSGRNLEPCPCIFVRSTRMSRAGSVSPGVLVVENVYMPLDLYRLPVLDGFPPMYHNLQVQESADVVVSGMLAAVPLNAYVLLQPFPAIML